MGLHLPVVAGRFVDRSNAEQERACLVHIATLADCAHLPRDEPRVVCR